MEIKNTKIRFKFHFLIILSALFIFSSKSSFAQLPGEWMIQSTQDTNYTYNSVYFDNFLTGWICGTHGKIFKSTGGGWTTTWVVQLTNSYENYLQKIEGVSGNNARYAYACGFVNNSHPAAGVIQETTNGGTIWTNKTINYFNFKNLHFINAFTGFVIGGRTEDSINYGVILKTINAGTGAANTIYYAYEGTAVQNIGMFKTISFINTNTGWITATNTSNTSTVIKTNNRGDSWNIIGSPLNNIFINDLKFLDSLNGFACGGAPGGAAAKILKTTNGGLTWAEKTFGNSNEFKSMSWVLWWNGNVQVWRGFAVGENGLVYRTDDMGNTWTQQLSPTINNLNGVYFVDNKVGWAVGNNGEIISTYNGGVLVNNISSAVPDGYRIYQNYPNPFNPTTTIKFDIVKAGYVKLEIYDGLGKKVEDLVSQNLAAGTYSTSWTAKGQPSGIYYYRITTPEFTKTMKMSLVK